MIRALVLDAVTSPETRRAYARSLDGFFAWRAQQDNPSFTRASLQAYRQSLITKGLAASSINQALAALRKLAFEAAANGLLDHGTAAGIAQVPGAKESGRRAGNWLTKQQAQALIHAPDRETPKGRRDRAALALLVGCGLRRSEAAGLDLEHLVQRDGRWVILDLKGKGGRIRTVPVPAWVKHAVDLWILAAGISTGRVLRGMNRHGQITGGSLTGEALRQLTAEYGAQGGSGELRPHDLRRTCAKLCRSAGGELEQIQLLLGHASIQTTERYLGTEQDLAHPPNDRLGLKWRDEA
jgi:integrase